MGGGEEDVVTNDKNESREREEYPKGKRQRTRKVLLKVRKHPKYRRGQGEKNGNWSKFPLDKQN